MGELKILHIWMNIEKKFSLCVSRAVANLSTLSEYCIPFINESGIFISYKSEFSEEETDNAKRL